MNYQPLLIFFIAQYLSQSLRYTQPIYAYTEQIEPITDISPSTFGYPTQVIIQGNDSLQLMSNPQVQMRVLFYGYRVPAVGTISPPQKRYLIIELNSNNQFLYIGYELILKAWPQYQMVIQQILKTQDLYLLQSYFSIYNLDPNFPNFYQNIKQYLLQDDQFKLKMNLNQISLNQMANQNILSNQQQNLQNFSNQQTLLNTNFPQNNTTQLPLSDTNNLVNLSTPNSQLVLNDNLNNLLGPQSVQNNLEQQQLLQAVQQLRQQQNQNNPSQTNNDPVLNALTNNSKEENKKMSQQQIERLIQRTNIVNKIYQNDVQSQLKFAMNENESQAAFQLIFENPKNLDQFSKTAQTIIENSEDPITRDENLNKLLRENKIVLQDLKREQLFEVQKTFDLRSYGFSMSQKQQQNNSNDQEMQFNENGELISNNKRQTKRPGDPVNTERVVAISDLFPEEKKDQEQIVIQNRQQAIQILTDYKNRNEVPPQYILDQLKKFNN